MAEKEMDIGKLVKEHKGQPFQLRLNLAQPLANMKFALAGRVVGVWDAPSSAEYVDIRFNKPNADLIRFRLGKVLAVPFNRIFVTVPGIHAGNFDILYGPDAFEVLRIYPSPAETDLVLANVLAQLAGPAAEIAFGQTAVGVAAVNVAPADPTRHGGVLQAAGTNAGIIYLGFDNTVAANNCFAELPAYASWSFDDWRGDVWAEASIAAQNVNCGEW